eukprot:gene7761-biopygen9104
MLVCRAPGPRLLASISAEKRSDFLGETAMDVSERNSQDITRRNGRHLRSFFSLYGGASSPLCTRWVLRVAPSADMFCQRAGYGYGDEFEDFDGTKGHVSGEMYPDGR